MNESDAPFDYGFYIAAAIIMWLIYFATTRISRYVDEYRMMRAERDWALAQLSEQGQQIPYYNVHGDQAA